MALLSDYTAGTVSSSGLVITGTGVAWRTARFQEGDEFIADGWRMLVQSVDSETQITLRANSGVQGSALSGAPYRLRYMSDGSRASAQARQMIDMLSGTGTLEGLAGLTTAADKMPYFTGPGGAAALTDLTAFGRTLLDDADAAAMRDTLGALGRTGVQTIDGSQIVTDARMSGSLSGYQQFPNGLILQWGRTETATNANGNAPVFYPVAFPNAPFIFLPINGHQEVVADPAVSVGTSQGLMANPAVAYASFRPNPGDAVPVVVNWIALGY